MVLLTGVFLTTADNSIVNVAVPAMRRDLAASGAQMQLVVAGYIVSFAVLLIIGARLGRIFGYKTAFLGGLSLFTLSSLACGLAPTAEALIVARLAQGVGAALLVPQVLTGIQATFNGRERTRAIGSYSLALAGGAALGQVAGGVLVTANVLDLGWRTVFLVNVPIGLALFLVGTRVLTRAALIERVRLDFRGAGILSIAMSLLIVPLVLGHETGWGLWAWFALALSLPAFALFLRVEGQTAPDARLLDPQIFMNRLLSLGLLAQTAASTTYAALLFVLALYLQEGLDRTALESGLALLSWVAGFAVAGISLQRLQARLPVGAAPLGFGLVAGAFGGLALLALGDIAHAILQTLFLAVGGFGMGLGFTALVDHLTTVVEPRFAAELSGLLNTNAELSAALGVALFGSFFFIMNSSATSRSLGAAFGLTLIGLALAALLAAVTAYLATRRSARRDRVAYLTASESQ